jgi:hypothetical protein
MNTETKLGGNFTLPGTSPNPYKMKIGIDSFVSAVPDALTGETLSPADRLRLLLDEIEFADRVGSTCLGLASITVRSFWILLRKRYWPQQQ